MRACVSIDIRVRSFHGGLEMVLIAVYIGGGGKEEKREKRHGEFIRIRRDSELNISKGRGVDDPRPRRLRRNHGANIAAAKKKRKKSKEEKKDALS